MSAGRSSGRRAAAVRTAGSRLGLLVAASGALSLGGRLGGIRALAALAPGAPPIRASTALHLVLAGAAIHVVTVGAQRARLALAAVGAGSCLLTLSAAPVGAEAWLARPRLDGSPTGGLVIAPLCALLVFVALAAMRPGTPRWHISSWASLAAGGVLVGEAVLLAGAPPGAETDRFLVAPVSLVLLTLAVVALYLVGAERMQLARTLLLDPTLRSSLLRRFALPIPLITVGPILLVVVLLRRWADDPEGAQIVALIGLGAVMVLVLSAGVLGGRWSGDVVRRLDRLREAASMIARGDHDVDIDASAADEIGELARRFDEMRRTLAVRSAEEGLTREAVRVVGAAPDLASAFEAFTLALKGEIPLDQSVYAAASDGGFRIAAAAGPVADPTAVGAGLPLSGRRLLEALEDRRPYLEPDTAEPDVGGGGSTSRALLAGGVRSYLLIPVFVGGRVLAVVVAGSLLPQTFTVQHLVLFEHLVRETSGSFHALTLLEAEREATRRLQELDALRSEFVGMIAHDLRSPMSVVAGYADTIHDRWDELPEDRKLEFLERISRNMSGLANLVEDVLQMANIESGTIRFESAEFDLRTLIYRAVDELEAGGEPARITVSLPDSLPAAMGDEQRQWQVLTNLLSNAMKFSEPGSPVEVTARPEGDHIGVYVTDHGAGIAAADIPKLFQKFSRLERPEGTRVKGTGLGLYICKIFVEGQGGTIGVRSEPGKGSTFTYTVPIAG